MSEDIQRAKSFNNYWSTSFKWIKPFIMSHKLGYEVAIAEIDDILILINEIGDPITVIDNV